MKTTHATRRGPRSRARQALAATVSLASLCGGAAIVSATATPAGAVSATGIGSLSCDELTGTGAVLDLSAATSYPIYSYFLVSVDGGTWQPTNWFYEDDGAYDANVNGWVATQPEQVLTSTVGGQHLVQAYEVVYAGGQYTYYNLSSCQTAQWDILGGGGPNGDGITITGITTSARNSHVAKFSSGAAHDKKAPPKFRRSSGTAKPDTRIVLPTAR